MVSKKQYGWVTYCVNASGTFNCEHARAQIQEHKNILVSTAESYQDPITHCWTKAWSLHELLPPANQTWHEGGLYSTISYNGGKNVTDKNMKYSQAFRTLVLAPFFPFVYVAQLVFHSCSLHLDSFLLPRCRLSLLSVRGIPLHKMTCTVTELYRICWQGLWVRRDIYAFIKLESSQVFLVSTNHFPLVIVPQIWQQFMCHI